MSKACYWCVNLSSWQNLYRFNWLEDQFRSISVSKPLLPHFTKLPPPLTTSTGAVTIAATTVTVTTVTVTTITAAATDGR